MPQVDPPLVVGIVGRHVVRADQVVNAIAGAAHGGNDVVSRFQFRDFRSDGLYLPESFVANDKELVARRRSTIFGGIDFFVGAVYAYAQDLHQHSTTVRNLIERGLGQLGNMDAIGFSRKYTDRFHFFSP